MRNYRGRFALGGECRFRLDPRDRGVGEKWRGGLGGPQLHAGNSRPGSKYGALFRPGFALAGRAREATRRELLAGLLAPYGAALPAADKLASPVFQVDVPAPTRDKPQSKIWFARGSWWAWLPVSGGSAVWRRTAAGWRRQPHLDEPLRGLPGQADVWGGEDEVCAVLVAPGELAFARLRWDAAAAGYRMGSRPARLAFPAGSDAAGGPETATIARDGRGRWWVAYNWRRRMWVRTSAGREWTTPIEVSERQASADDLCSIVALPGAVGVIWSDQDHDAVYLRRHVDGAPAESWDVPEIAASGGKTADDHINAVAGPDGSLYVATKNSVDLAGSPQLVLRVRNPQGRWSNHPYALRTSTEEPTRPIVLLGGDPKRLLLLHTIGYRGRKPPRSAIVRQTSPLARIDLSRPAIPLIDSGGAVNNVTGPKGPLPSGQPGIVLASGADGRVYEGRVV